MTVTILRWPGRDAVTAERDIQVLDEIGMGQVDAGIEDRDLDAFAGEARRIGARLRRVIGPDPRDAGRDRLIRDLEFLIRDDRADVRVLEERSRGLRGSAEDEAVDRVAEDEPGPATCRLREPVGIRARIRPGPDGDDPLTGRRGADAANLDRRGTHFDVRHDRGRRGAGATGLVAVGDAAAAGSGSPSNIVTPMLTPSLRCLTLDPLIEPPLDAAVHGDGGGASLGPRRSGVNIDVCVSGFAGASGPQREVPVTVP